MEKERLYMDKERLYEYIVENFTLDGTSRRLVYNILDYVAGQSFTDEDEERDLLLDLLDGIGLTEEDIELVRQGNVKAA